jgi:hypothetical protein
MEILRMENETLCLTFDQQTGALVGLSSPLNDWKILARPQLGLSFQLLVPLSEERRNNPVYGEKQKLTSVAISDDNRQATFYWERIQSEYGGVHDIRIQMDVHLHDEQAIFSMRIENRSEYPVENVYFPYLGEVKPPPGANWFKSFFPTYASAQEWLLWPVYENLRGYFGVDYPTQFAKGTSSSGTPMVPYILLRSAGQGLYVGVHEPSPELVAWHTELRPGYDNSINAHVPQGDKIGDKEVAIRFAAVHLPYIQAGENRKLTAIALQGFTGNWHRGVDIYKCWLNSWLTTPRLPEWTREPHAWQQVHINSPEDELRVKFRDLVQIGEQCARNGVRAIQLVGWNDGGQDQGNPCHDPDPRLGTFDELKEAIRQIQSLGVKVVLFSKFTWADRATEWFRKELIHQAIKDPYGDYYQHPGYQYQTATQLLDINTKRLIPMCFLSENYLEICEVEFQKTLALGVDGILFDECLHHSPALLCFDPGHGHRYAAPVYANDRELIKRFLRFSEPLNPDFLYSGEGCYDWEFEVYHLSYHRSENTQHIPLARYVFPDIPLMTAVTGFNDRNMINQCLLYRYIISYEPYNFKGHLEDYPLTLAYGRKMNALRSQLREYFWDGEFRDTQGAVVTTGGKPHHPYSVFINHKNGMQGIVVANYDEQDTIDARVILENGGSLKRYRLVDEPEWRSDREGVIIPPCSAAVMIEQG